MVVAMIVVCEIAFWVVLAGGLLTRYVLRRPRAGALMLVCVPLVDLALLAFTVVDLRRGAEPELAHGLAAVYLGFSIAFGHAMVRWADVRVAHRFAGGPAPEPGPAGGTPDRLRREWQEFASAFLAVAISTALLVGAASLAADGTDTGELTAWIGRLAVVLAIWLIGWPLRETVRAVLPSRRNGSPSDRSSSRPQPSR